MPEVAPLCDLRRVKPNRNRLVYIRSGAEHLVGDAVGPAEIFESAKLMRQTAEFVEVGNIAPSRCSTIV
jgi:hypothetical protein